MDLQLRPEWEGIPLRGKCFPMSRDDCEEIQRQVDELVEAGLVEEYQGQEFPKYCSPTFLVEKDKGKATKISTTKRMVGDYRKLNQRTIPHAGFLPDLEATVEALAACRFKSKMDMRSGFWQVELSPKAQELTAFVIPSGRVFRWKIMPFGLTNAPGVFQELMMKVISQMKLKPRVRDLLKKGCVTGVFFDDVGLGSDSIEDHRALLEEFFTVCQGNHLRIKLTKCEFCTNEMEYLGFDIGYGSWKPSRKKVEALANQQVKNLKELRSFLGACNFYRRHIENFTFSSATLTDLTKKGVKWIWGTEEERCFQELKRKISDVRSLGVPRSQGEVMVVTDASDVGGGASVYQWQVLNPEEVSGFGTTTGVQKDGTLRHTHQNCVLVPIGHFNWKWNDARKNYATYEQELLSGVLALGSQRRILGHLPIVWLCDQEAVSHFVKGTPPDNARQKRWWIFLSQFRLTIFHIPGVKNEFCDLLSREGFNHRFQCDVEELAKQAFQRMDLQLDLRMETMLVSREFQAQDYFPEYERIWNGTKPGHGLMDSTDQRFYHRDENKLWCEKKLVLPPRKLKEGIVWCHINNGHPGAQKTAWFVESLFHTDMEFRKLEKEVREVIKTCRVCAESKPNQAEDRGTIGALPIPHMVNEILYVDFIQMESYSGVDYIMTIMCGLSRFAQFVPCRKTITGEGALQLIFGQWIQKFGRPREIHSDNDVRFVSHKGWWQSVLKSMKVNVSFAAPRRPEGNGMCERMNRSFVQTMRVLRATQKDRDWLKLVPYATWVLNSQQQGSTGMAPSELFFGRPTWIPECVPEPDGHPTVSTWIETQKDMETQARERLQKMRQKSLARANKGRKEASYKVGEYALVHKHRFPQWPTSKLGSQWFGPYRIIGVHGHSVVMRASPKLGGEIKVSHQFLKRFPEQVWEDESDEEEDVPTAMEDEKEEEVRMQEDPEEVVPQPDVEVEEEREEGTYDVEKVVAHKYKQGWRFLTVWKGYPLEDATWEPTKAFVLANGALTAAFKEYCEEHELEGPLRQAMSLSNKARTD